MKATIELNELGKLMLLLNEIKTPSFVRILNYSNDKGQGEVANYTINMGIDYGNAKQADIKFLSEPSNMTLVNFSEGLQPLAEAARLEMYESRVNPKTRHSQAQTEAYVQLCPNIRLHAETGRIFVYGFVVKKDVIVQGKYDKVDSSAMTRAKRCIDKELKCPQFRQLAFDKLKTVRAKGTEIEIVLG
jgi:hypothetical protein